MVFFFGTAMTDAPNRILVIKSRHIGDVLLTGPLLSTLRKWYPNCRISVLVKEETAPMLEGHPDVHEVIHFQQRAAQESGSAFLARQWRWWLALRRRRFDWVINTTEGDRGIIAGFLSGAKRRTGLLKPGKSHWWRKRLLTEPVARRSGLRHAVVHNLDLLGWHDETLRPDTRVRIAFDDQDTQFVTQTLTSLGWDGEQPLAHVHPVARWRFKCWTDAGMAQAIDYLQGRGLAVGITASPDPEEMAKVRAILALCQTRPLDLSGRFTLKQAAAFAVRCRLFLGVDTAMMHIAAALDVPVVAIFGPTMASEWGPWPNDWQGGDEASPYPKKRGFQQCGPHLVIQKNWPCVPCGRDGCGGTKISNCLTRLEWRELRYVLEALS